MNKKKTYDEKIIEIQEKLKNIQKEKKEYLEKRGKQLWTRVKQDFLERENAVEILLQDKNKLGVLKEEIKKCLDNLKILKNSEDKKEIKKEEEENDKK